MRSYILDEISTGQMQRLRKYLKENAISSSMADIFWVEMPKHLLSELQLLHTGCHPHVFAIELGKDWVKFELYVRSLHNMRCSCPGYCTKGQQDFVIAYANGIISSLEIRT